MTYLKASSLLFACYEIIPTEHNLHAMFLRDGLDFFGITSSWFQSHFTETKLAQLEEELESFEEDINHYFSLSSDPDLNPKQKTILQKSQTEIHDERCRASTFYLDLCIKYNWGRKEAWSFINLIDKYQILSVETRHNLAQLYLQQREYLPIREATSFLELLINHNLAIKPHIFTVFSDCQYGCEVRNLKICVEALLANMAWQLNPKEKKFLGYICNTYARYIPEDS